MGITSVTRKGKVTIPKALRQQLGLRQGSRVRFERVGDHIEMRVSSSPVEPAAAPGSGFGMLERRRKAVPADFDPASLLRP